MPWIWAREKAGKGSYLSLRLRALLTQQGSAAGAFMPPKYLYTILRNHRYYILHVQVHLFLIIPNSWLQVPPLAGSALQWTVS